MSSHQMLRINSIIQHCVSCWTTYILTDGRLILEWVLRNTILPVVFYGCKNRSLILREEQRIRMFESRVLRKVYGP